jgi:hypothetical protein
MSTSELAHTAERLKADYGHLLTPARAADSSRAPVRALEAARQRTVEPDPPAQLTLQVGA